MAYTLTWSPVSRDDLHDIVAFIARDNPPRAETFGYRLIAATERLLQFPEIGRMVPEYRSPHLREIVVGSYRIVHRVDHHRQTVEIIRVWHGARGKPEL